MINCKIDYYLDESLDKDGTFYLLSDIAEKTLKTEGFKILNEDNFSIVELDWLRVNYKFMAKSKYL